MRRAGEALVFLGLASAVHAGVWAGLGAGGAVLPGAGQGGTAPLTLAAADPATAALVRRWEAPPVAPAAEAPAMQAPAPSASALPAPPSAEAAVPVPRTAPAATPPSIAEKAPDAAAAVPAAAPDPVRPRPRPSAEPQAERAAQDAATPSPPQRAAGAGDRQAAGQHGQGTARAASAGQVRVLEREWGAAILQRIARRQRYPAGDHGSGTVRVMLEVGRDGSLQGLSLAASSGSAALDRAALDAVQRAGRFPGAPAGLEKAAYIFAVPMTFRQN